MNQRDYRGNATVLKALANEQRLRIVDRLAKSPACVCELVELLGLDQSTVSKHLSVLRSAALVDSSRRGKHSYYRLLAPCVLPFLDCAAAVRADSEHSDGESQTRTGGAVESEEVCD